MLVRGGVVGGAFEQSEYYVQLYAESSPMAYSLIFTVLKYLYIYILYKVFFNMDTQCKHVKERFVPSVSIITHKVLADVRKRAPTACAASQHISPVPAQSLVEVFARWTCDLSRCFLM